MKSKLGSKTEKLFVSVHATSGDIEVEARLSIEQAAAMFNAGPEAFARFVASMLIAADMDAMRQEQEQAANTGTHEEKHFTGRETLCDRCGKTEAAVGALCETCAERQRAADVNAVTAAMRAPNANPNLN